MITHEQHTTNRENIDDHAVAILGAGPAGLLAAHAVALAGRTPLIFSSPETVSFEESQFQLRPKKSEISGATFLHAPIPDVTSPEPDVHVSIEKLGSREEYAAKVYGYPNAPCSWDKFESGHLPAWSLRSVYDNLWERYSYHIIPTEVGFEDAEEMIDQFPLVVSTIPAPILCDDQCNFLSKSIWIEPKHRDICEHLGDPCVIYNGQIEQLYSRTSLLFGHGATEYPGDPFNKGPHFRTEYGWVNGIKPTWHNCNCLPEIVRAGRFGEWKPGVLTHHAFQKVWNLMFDNFEGT